MNGVNYLEDDQTTIRPTQRSWFKMWMAFIKVLCFLTFSLHSCSQPPTLTIEMSKVPEGGLSTNDVVVV